ncbi:MAG: beta,2-mannobiose phosphorylase / 1,2-beta-oligomannan phosphorylase [Candidatus Parcubacteria bacterium]|nr:beta,2-mannobiose phosphorylase / 1,2-beta-oligomannan phosphorylase [Candidatus Parcubacteria bacterium]
MREHPWEAAAAFNGCPVIDGEKTYMVYRAMSEPDLLREPHIRMSVIARGVSTDGLHYRDRHVLISPDREFDYFGCEDPRVTKFEGTYYIFYTALGGWPLSPDNIRVAVALSKDIETITEKHLVTPFNAKAMALFPERINGKMAAIVTVNTDRAPSDICYVEFDKPEDMWSPEFWANWQQNLDAHKIHIRRLPGDHLEAGAAPVKTDKGWLLIYSHIQRYGHGDQVFGIEAVLLEEKNPRNVIGRTKGPFMVPDEYYENMGQVAHIIFPSGALIRGGRLEIYYGAADTHCAMATIPLNNLLSSITDTEKPIIKRFPGNPIITPRPGILWESKGTLNPGAIDLGGKIHLLYRAVSADNISTIGYAVSSDGLSIDERPEKPIYFPRADFESKGCEDPRLVLINDRVYMAYSGFDGGTPRVAVSSISSKDFLARKWGSWTAPEVITPPSVPNKDAAILPEPMMGGYMVFHRVRESVCADYVASLDFSRYKVTQCIEIITPRRGMWDGGKVGISAPPVKTKHGWLLLYHGVSWSTTYRVGAVLLDLKDPTIVKARTAIPLFEPQEQYENKGTVNNVVFPCGLVVRGTTAYMYYGAADDVVGVATMKMATLLRTLEV